MATQDPQDGLAVSCRAHKVLAHPPKLDGVTLDYGVEYDPCCGLWYTRDLRGFVSWCVVLVGCLAVWLLGKNGRQGPTMYVWHFVPFCEAQSSLSLVFRAQRTLALNVIHARVRGTPGTCEDFVPRCGECEFLARKAFASLSISHARRATNTVLVVATDHDVETIYSMTWDRWQRGSRRGLPLSVCGFIGDLTLAVECRANGEPPPNQAIGQVILLGCPFSAVDHDVEAFYSTL